MLLVTCYVWAAMHIRQTILLVVLVASLSGCSDDGGASPDAFSPDAGSTDAVLDRSSSLEAAPDAAATARVCGSLEDKDALKMEGGGVILCNDDECHTDTVGVTGAFCVHINKPGDYLFHAAFHKAYGKNYGDVMFPLTLSAAEIQAGAKIDVGTVVMPLLGSLVNLDPAAGGKLVLGGGASLDVPPGSAVLPPLTSKAEVALSTVQKAHLHPRLLSSLGSKTPAAAFLIVPVDVTFTKPVSYVLPSTLTTGTQLEVYRVHHKTGQPELHGEAKVGTSGEITATGPGLEALGWLLMVSK